MQSQAKAKAKHTNAKPHPAQSLKPKSQIQTHELLLAIATFRPDPHSKIKTHVRNQA